MAPVSVKTLKLISLVSVPKPEMTPDKVCADEDAYLKVLVALLLTMLPA